MQWRAKAACRGADPEQFAPRDSHTNADWDVIQTAADTYCNGCPVLRQCRADGDRGKHTGLWGGQYKHVHHSRIRVRIFVPLDGRKPRLPARAAS